MLNHSLCVERDELLYPLMAKDILNYSKNKQPNGINELTWLIFLSSPKVLLSRSLHFFPHFFFSFTLNGGTLYWYVIFITSLIFVSLTFLFFSYRFFSFVSMVGGCVCMCVHHKLEIISIQLYELILQLATPAKQTNSVRHMAKCSGTKNVWLFKRFAMSWASQIARVQLPNLFR